MVLGYQLLHQHQEHYHIHYLLHMFCKWFFTSDGSGGLTWAASGGGVHQV